MGKLSTKLKGSVAIAGIAYTTAQTIKCIRETQAIVIPPARPQKLPKEIPVNSVPTQADLTPLPNSTDLVSIARPFPYVESSGPKSKDTSDTEFVDSSVYNPDLPFKWGPLKPQNDTSSGSFDPDLFHSNVRMFDPYPPPNYLPEGLIEKSSDIAQLGKYLLQVGLG